MGADLDIAKKEILRKYKDLAMKYARLEERGEEHRHALEVIEGEKKEIFEGVSDLEAAARVFGFDLMEVARAEVGSDEGPSSRKIAPPPNGDGSISVTDFVLESAREAYPKPVRAAELRKELEQRGLEVHEKTVGMTLYRWLKRGALRREKIDWYFIPEDQREKENPGSGDQPDDPGLFKD